MRVLLTGWPSFRHGEATAGDVLSMRRVSGALEAAGIPHDAAWSPVFAPGALSLEQALPEHYSHLVFTCGPVHGWQVRWLHERYARCRRIAVGVSVIAPRDPAVTGFHDVLARDGTESAPARDLAAPPRHPAVPVVGVVLAPGQGEYADRRRHDSVHRRLRAWVGQLDGAPVPLETRLDTGDWRLCSTAEQCGALFARTDVVVTSRLHGLVLALSQAVPALAVDPVAGGGKVTDQARAWQWPAVVTAEQLADGRVRDGSAFGPLDSWWEWCLSGEARALARARSAEVGGDHALVTDLMRALAGTPVAEHA